MRCLAEPPAPPSAPGCSEPPAPAVSCHPAERNPPTSNPWTRRLFFARYLAVVVRAGGASSARVSLELRRQDMPVDTLSEGVIEQSDDLGSGPQAFTMTIEYARALEEGVGSRAAPYRILVHAMGETPIKHEIDAVRELALPSASYVQLGLVGAVQTLGNPIAGTDIIVNEFRWKCRAAEPPPYDSWRGLYLELNVEWPLNLIVTRNALAQYSALFQFLLALKRVSFALQLAWKRMGDVR